MIGAVGRVLEVDDNDELCLLLFNLSPQGVSFSVWVPFYCLDYVNSEDAEVTKHKTEDLDSILDQVIEITTRNLILDLMSKFSQGKLGRGRVPFQNEQLKTQVPSFLSFLENAVTRFVSMSPRNDENSRSNPDSWNGDLENEIFDQKLMMMQKEPEHGVYFFLSFQSFFCYFLIFENFQSSIIIFFFFFVLGISY